MNYLIVSKYLPGLNLDRSQSAPVLSTTSNKGGGGWEDQGVCSTSSQCRGGGGQSAPICGYQQRQQSGPSVSSSSGKSMKGSPGKSMKGSPGKSISSRMVISPAPFKRTTKNREPVPGSVETPLREKRTASGHNQGRHFGQRASPNNNDGRQSEPASDKTTSPRENDVIREPLKPSPPRLKHRISGWHTDSVVSKGHMDSVDKLLAQNTPQKMVSERHEQERCQSWNRESTVDQNDDKKTGKKTIYQMPDKGWSDIP